MPKGGGGKRGLRVLLAAFAAVLGGVCVGLAQDRAPDRAPDRADTPVNPFKAAPDAAAQGRELFNQTCAACHGADATGGRGPALDTGNFPLGGEDFELFQTIRGGVVGTQMPAFAALPADDVWKIVAYLKSLAADSRPGPDQARGDPARGDPARGDPARGEALFFGKGRCADCHEVDGRGGLAAPDLSAIGASGAPLRESVLHLPPRPVRGPPVFHPRFVTATRLGGEVVKGVVVSEDSFSLVIRTADGRLEGLDKTQVRTIEPDPEAKASMDVGARLSPAEIDDVLAYLWGRTRRDLAQASRTTLPAGVPYRRLENSAAEPQNWLTYWGSYDGRHFSELKQIAPANVARLQARWVAAMPGASTLEATPLVVDGIMYVSGQPGDVYALDARTGLQIWKFHRRQETVNPYQLNPYNRGAAILGGRLFFATLDDRVIALDARTGRELWEKQIADPLLGYTMTSAPLAVKDKIVVGVSGGEHGISGFVEAYDAATGQRLWRFSTIPGPGEPGHETWPGDSWRHGSAATWLTGSYDPELGLVYWAVGNPGPDFNAAVRSGDDLYSCSVIALDAETGALKWHYQFTPNDSHDWDATEDLVLAQQPDGGRDRKVLLHADRNGFFYVLDRSNGAFLRATPFVRQNWNAGFDARGRPQVRPEAVASPQGAVTFPGVGGTNFQAPSYDPRTGAFYLAFIDSEGFAVSAPAIWEKGRLFFGRGSGKAPPAPPPSQGVRALDAATGRTLWTFPLVRPSLSAGVLGTRGGVLFAASAEGNLIALDMKTGQPLWRFQTGAAITAAPMSYAVDGRQYVAVASGERLYSFALPDMTER
jgi:PQQ-dependent dehydrogenase (methanol/ethanol family)